ncbi:MAG: DMT family transporter [Actinomycetota bacterium]|nr:DMT family transporter [Actinomycetota bacterium]
MVVTLALLSALIVGVGDYLGGRGTARRPAIVVTFFSQITACLVQVPLVIALGWTHLQGGDVVLGLASGAAAGVGYIAFFHGLAHGRMAVVAPLAALTTALVPVVIDIVDGVRLPGGRWWGVAIALAAIPMVALRPGGDHSLRLLPELALAIGAGLGFATFFVAMGHTSDSSGQWPVVFASLGGAAMVGLISLLQRQRLGRPPLLALGSGACTAVAGVMAVKALQIGPIAVATVLASLYPVVTAGMAAKIDRERVSALNAFGVAAALAGAALIAVYR